MNSTFPRASLFRRCLAMTYDLLVILTLSMCLVGVNLIVVYLLDSYQILDLSSYEDHSAFLNTQWWFGLEIILGVWLFYAWFWYDGGQTIGMRPWRLKVLSTNDEPLTFKRAFLRAVFSCFGLGNLLMLFPYKDKLSLQDRLTNTEMVILTKEANKYLYIKGMEYKDD